MIEMVGQLRDAQIHRRLGLADESRNRAIELTLDARILRDRAVSRRNSGELAGAQRECVVGITAESDKIGNRLLELPVADANGPLQQQVRSALKRSCIGTRDAASPAAAPSLSKLATRWV